MYQNVELEIDEKNYYFFPDGRMLSGTGWYEQKTRVYPGQIQSVWFYILSDGSKKVGWLAEQNNWYYFDESGKMLSSDAKLINNKKYVFDSAGKMVVNNWQNIVYWVAGAEGYHRYSEWYYATQDGSVLTGWFNDGQNWYYFMENGVMTQGFASTIDNKTYLFDENGWWVTTKGWKKIMRSGLSGGVLYPNWYYLLENGEVKTGWFNEGEDTYFLGSYGRMVSDTVEEGYVFGNDGRMLRNQWYKLYGNTWVYANSDGTARKGWLTDGDKTYYFNDYGSMQAGTQRYIDGVWYTFDENGVMQ